MSRGDTIREAPTRREYVKYGGAVVGGGLFAGCSGDADADSSATEADVIDESTATSDSSYSVTMSPVGTVEFEEPPETVFTRLTHLAGMAFALGRGNDVKQFGAWPNYESGPYPENPSEEQLFDRQRVADVINGDI